MRPVANFTLHAILAAALAALAATSAAAGQSDAFLELGSIQGEAEAHQSSQKGHIELLSYSFGESSASKVDGFTVKQGVKPRQPALRRLFVKSWSTSGDASAERTHKPLRVRMEYDRGSVTLNGRFPACRVGAAYPTATIGQGDERYEMQDVTVAACSPDGMSLNFKKVTVRGWDPEKKEL